MLRGDGRGGLNPIIAVNSSSKLDPDHGLSSALEETAANSVHGMSVSSAPLGWLTFESVSKSSDGVADVAHATRRAHATP